MTDSSADPVADWPTNVPIVSALTRYTYRSRSAAFFVASRSNLANCRTRRDGDRALHDLADRQGAGSVAAWPRPAGVTARSPVNPAVICTGRAATLAAPVPRTVAGADTDTGRSATGRRTVVGPVSVTKPVAKA